MRNNDKEYRNYRAQMKQKLRDERLHKGQALIDAGSAVNETELAMHFGITRQRLNAMKLPYVWPEKSELVNNRLYIGVSDDMLAAIKVRAGDQIPAFVRDCIQRALEDD